MSLSDFPGWVIVLVLCTDALAFVRAIARAHGVQKTLAWLLAILAFPGVGALLYLTLANPSIRRTTRRMSERRAHLREAARAVQDAGANSCEPADTVFAVATGTTGLLRSEGNQVELLADDDLAFEKLEGALAGARRSIWAEYYIVQDDATGHRFLDLLAERARAGVEVRFLFDAVGSWRIDSAKTRAIREAGGCVEAFLPVNPLRRRWAVHLRNHRKVVLVDGEIAFTGGMNIGDEYSGRARGRHSFRDTHLALRGPAVADLAQIFLEDWSFATGETLGPAPHPSAPQPATASVAIVPSGPDQEHNASQYVYFAAINSARRRLWLTSPYFIPDETTLRALTAAALRGVDVRLIVPAHSDVLVAGLAARSYYPPLSKVGVRIFEYLPAMMHAKTMIVDDDLALVGSANLDIRSFVYNFELSALVSDQGFVEALARRFDEDLSRSRELAIQKPSYLSRLGSGFARLLSPLL